MDLVMDAPMARELIGRIVARAARQWRRAVDAGLQEFGLTEATWLPLLHLSRAGAPMRQKDLAASLALDGSTVARLLDSLQASGLIERREDEGDRRAKTIHLTGAGETLVAQVEAVSRAVRLTVTRDISDDDIARTAMVLERVCTALAEIGEKEPAKEPT